LPVMVSPSALRQRRPEQQQAPALQGLLDG
jgi:hypothetical protein